MLASGRKGMLEKTRVAFLSLLAFLAPQTVPAAAQSFETPANSLLRLVYTVSPGTELTLGTGFPCLFGEQIGPLLLSAHHVILPVLRDSRYSMDRLKARSVSDSSITSALGENVPIPDATPGSNAADIAAFLLPETAGFKGLRMAEVMPIPGDRVWLYARFNSAWATDRLLHPAEVALIGDTLFHYVFTDDEVMPAPRVQRTIADSLADLPDLPAGYSAEALAKFHYMVNTSGAPVLNERGEVIAIHVGVGTVEAWRAEDPGCCEEWRDDQLWGYAVTAGSVRNHLKAWSGGEN